MCVEVRKTHGRFPYSAQAQVASIHCVITHNGSAWVIECSPIPAWSTDLRAAYCKDRIQRLPVRPIRPTSPKRGTKGETMPTSPKSEKRRGLGDGQRRCSPIPQSKTASFGKRRRNESRPGRPTAALVKYFYDKESQILTLPRSSLRALHSILKVLPFYLLLFSYEYDEK